MTQLVMSLVVSRLDYCNAVLASLPASTIAPLQRVVQSCQEYQPYPIVTSQLPPILSANAENNLFLANQVDINAEN